MTVYHFDSHEHGSSGLYSASSNAAISSSVARTGSRSLQTLSPSTTGATYAAYGKSGSAFGNTNNAILVDTLYSRFYFRYATKPAANSEIFFAFAVVATSSHKLALRINSSGNILAYNSANALLDTGASVLDAGTWYLIEVMCGTGTTAAWEVKVDGVSEISGTGNLSTNQHRYAVFGKSINRSSQSIEYFFDDICTRDDDWIGAGQSVLLLPNADGTYSTFSIGAGTGSHYEQVDDWPTDGATTYLASTGSVGDKESFTVDGSALSGTINAVCPIGATAAISGSAGVRFFFRIGGADYEVANLSGGSYTLAKGFFQSVSPDTGVAWTLSEVQNLEIGVKENLTGVTGLSSLGLMVDYIPAAPAVGHPAMKRMGGVRHNTGPFGRAIGMRGW